MDKGFKNFIEYNLINCALANLRLEGWSTTHLETKRVLDKYNKTGIANNTENSIIIVNTKRAWENLLEFYRAELDLNLVCFYHNIVSYGLISNTGKLRNCDVFVKGLNNYVHRPKRPNANIITRDLEFIKNERLDIVDKALKVMLYLMREQIFDDCNKRTALMVANHILVQNGIGLLIFPEDTRRLNNLMKKLMYFYETGDYTTTIKFIRDRYIKYYSKEMNLNGV